MLNNRWGRRSYRDAATDSGGGRGNGASAGAGVPSREQQQQRAMQEGRDMKKEAQNKKFFFQQKLDLEGKRKQLGKGNMVTFLMEGNQGFEKADMNKVLRVGGFTPDQILGIKLNDFRKNQVEVLFQTDVAVDTLLVEQKLREAKMDVIVSKFDYVEEFLMIYGLPLSDSIEVLKQKITESIKPFVKKVFEIIPCVHKSVTDEDFFDGHYDGNWRVKVVPKSNVQIPNFIVVGHEAQVMGKAVYTKKLGGLEQMCADCFSTDHFKQTDACPGPRKWSDYCQEFKDKWEKLSCEETLEEEVLPSDDEEETRLKVLNKTLIRDLQKIETERNEYRNKLDQQQNLEDEFQVLIGKVDVLESEKTEVEKSANKTENMLKEVESKLTDSVDENNVLRAELEKNKARLEEFEQKQKELVEISHRRMSLLSGNFSVDDLSENDDIVIDSVIVSDTQITEELPPFHGFLPGSTPSKFEAVEVNPVVTLTSAAVTVPVSSCLSSSGKMDDTPKEKRVRPSDSPDMCKKKSKVHPEIGKKIWIETLNGRENFLIHSKPNSKMGDYVYSVLSDSQNKSKVDLKDVNWDYIEMEQ